MSENEQPAPATEQETAVAPPAKRSIPRWLVWSVLGIVVVLAGLLAGALTWIDSAGGHRWLVERINASGIAKLKSLEGSLWRGVTVNGLVVDTAAVTVKLDRGYLEWAPEALLARRVSVSRLELGHLDITSKPSPPNQPVSPPPTSLSLPVAIDVDAASLQRFTLAGSPVDLKQVQLNLHSDGDVHRLDLQRLDTPRGRLKAQLSLDGRAPFAVAGRLGYAGVIEERQLESRVNLSGSLRDLGLNGSVKGEKVGIDLDSRLDVFAPYAYAMLKSAQLKAHGVNPAALQPGLPKAALDVELSLAPSSGKLAAGRLSLKNALPGPVNTDRLPLETLSAAFTVSNDALDLTTLLATLPGGGQLKGRGQFQADKLDATVDIAGLDLSQLVQRQPKSRLGGQILLKGAYAAPDVVAKLDDPTYKAALNADLGWIRPQTERRLAIRSAELKRGNSTLSLKGEFGFEREDFVAEATLDNVNPAEFAAVPAGRISGRVDAKGALKPALSASVKYELAQSSFNNRPLSGKGELDLTETRLKHADLWLALGSNRITARGALGAAGDKLDLQLALDGLNELGPGFGGRVQGTTQLIGAFKKPLIKTSLNVAGLATPFGVKLARGKLDGQLYSDLTSPMQFDVDLSGLEGFDAKIAQLKLVINGTRGTHTLRLAATGQYHAEPIGLDLAAAGGLDAQWQWRGRINKLDGRAMLPISVQSAVDATFGASKVEVGATTLAIGESRIRLDRLFWQPGRLETDGNAERLVTAELLKLADFKAVQSDLVLGGRWQLKQGATLDGDVTLNRLSGDIRVPASERSPAHALQLDQLSARIQARQSQVSLDGQIHSSRFGQIALTGATRIDAPAWQVEIGAPLTLRAAGKLPDLAKVSPLISDSLQLKGAIDFDVSRSGPMSQGVLAGTVNGDYLSIRDAATGVSLQDGKARVRLSQNRVVLDTFTFKGGRGDLNATGQIDLSDNGADANATITARQLTLINKPDMVLVVSGKGDVRYGKEGLSVTGNLKADHGDIRYRSTDVPHLSDDVVIVGQKRDVGKPLPLANLQFEIDLGDDFTFRGYGLEAQLSGLLRLKTTPNQSLQGFGTVKVEEGTYRAYGQKLAIERGIVSFSGQLDNPGLDILAVREGLSVEAGVEVKGSALNPRVKLYSNPSVPENEKLSWLLFGHGTDNMDKGDSAVLLQFLNAAFASGDSGESFSDELFGKLGIDEVGVASDKMEDGTTTQVVTVSKRLNKWLTLGLDKSVNGLKDAVRFTVQLSRRWSFVTRVGTDESTFDAKYSINFDSLWGNDKPATPAKP
ncbi:translocation/assembly module TamB domain-containing protein [Jeongeupia naejangsanensis]|uniref:Translocation/assembly module TamB domain-containing protein n=1 Tax=Jeongeupia naejangsanensis TaxID=613195 RepID=A0ABS2BGB2_9NEIS|nr:translocation/assembly module TamB domain-containing protein [Jeongeupia naejangsanensis]MBM3114641.1 translocation/assembly module TamB domain-containing protein [Jeongeupia naejangsanensis]